MAYLKEQKVIIGDLENLDIQTVFLIPFGPKGGPKRSVEITAENGRRFSGVELLYKAAAIQSQWSRINEPGVGIYRSGIQKGRPSYYIGRFHDLAGFTKEKKVARLTGSQVRQ